MTESKGSLSLRPAQGFQPTPELGYAHYNQYLATNFNYPPEAKANQVEGEVVIELTVGEDDNLTNLSVVKSLGYGCDELVQQLVRNGPSWKALLSSDSVRYETARLTFSFDL